MKQQDYLKDISEIKNMMNKSSQFLSLSGLSGVLAGIYALAGAYVASLYLPDDTADIYMNRLENEAGDCTYILIAIAAAVVVLSILTGLILSKSKAAKQGQQLWNGTSKRLVANFMIPLLTGGVFVLLLLQKEIYGLLAPVMLIFYGLACVNASKYTLRDVRYLGLTLVVVGLAAAYFDGYELEFWAFGFGICHIFYGLVMYFKYDRN